MKGIFSISGLLFSAALLAPPALADIYIYYDDNGVKNYTNIRPAAHYKIEKIIRESVGTGKTAPPRRLATASRKNDPAVKKIVAEAASAFRMDPALVHAIIQTESAFDVNAVSAKGASGLMQLMPATAKRYGVHDIFDPEQNVWGGVRYMRDLLEQFNHDLPLALAAYNAGENAVLRYGGIPPYPETRNYVQRVIERRDNFNQ